MLCFWDVFRFLVCGLILLVCFCFGCSGVGLWD